MGKHWSDFWQQGHLTSFGCDLSANYYGPLKELWLNFFSAIKSQNIQVLDIGSGNGPLAKLATEANFFPKAFHCVDAAMIETSHLNHRKNVFFYPNTQAETLPFEDNSMDVVVSQFGIEYSDIQKALLEINRVCKPRAIVKFVIHSTHSSIVEPNSKILDKIEEIMNEENLFGLIEALVRAKSDNDFDMRYTEKIRLELNTILSRISASNHAGLYGSGLPVLLKAIFTREGVVEVKLKKIETFAKEMEAQFRRLTELKLASRNELQIQEISNRLQGLGFLSKDYSIVKHNKEEVLGWHITAEKTEDSG